MEAAMAGRRQRMSPLDTALVRLADLAGRGVMPGRMAREVEVIMAGWVGGAEAVDPDEVCERLDAMHEQLATGAAAAAEQLGEIDADDAAALRHAKLVHAALVAAVEAVERARGAQSPAAPAPVAAWKTSLAVAEAGATQTTTEAAQRIAPTPAGAAVTIDPLAGRNPQGVDQIYPAELRWGDEPKQGTDTTKPIKARPTERKKRKSRREEEGGAITLLS
jgi:hypothetical protein